jgi:hypothetical protein
MALLLFGCASSGGATSDPEFPPRPDGHPIPVFESAPQCPYLELGEVSAQPHNHLATESSVLADLKRAARELGGDALLEVAVDDRRRSPNRGVIEVTRTPPMASPSQAPAPLKAEAIRFTDPDCQS